MIRAFAALLLVGCHSLPPGTVTPAKPYGPAVVAAWQDAALSPLSPDCLGWLRRLRVRVVKDARPLCGGEDRGACCYKFHREGFAWTAESYPTAIIHESRPVDGCAVHEAVHIAAQCAHVPHVGHPAHLFGQGGIEERAHGYVKRLGR